MTSSVALVLFLSAVLQCHQDLSVVNCQAVNTPPACQPSLANQCTDAAIKASAATGCNWYLVIPALSSCLQKALSGCNYAEVQVWEKITRDYNISLQADSCNPSCTNQAAKILDTQQCFTYSNGLQFETLLELINDQQQATPTRTQCSILSAINSCVTSSTSGCPALQSYSYARIQAAPGATDAYLQCNLLAFQPATTNAPVLLLNANLLALSTTAASSTPSVVTYDQGQLILVALGSVIIVITLIVILLLIICTCRIRHNTAMREKSLLKDWRPFGHKIFTQPPRDAATIVRPMTGLNAYKPISSYPSNDGFINDAWQHA
jgi:hypothetical protein